MFSSPRLFACAASLAFVTALAHGARADDPKPPTENDVKPKGEYVPELDQGDARKNGVDWKVGVNSIFTLNDNRNVIGQPDGSTITFGLRFDAGATVNHDAHEWRTTLTLGEGITRTPLVDEFIKSRDELAFDTIYLYHWTPAFGPFARFSADTSLFQGIDDRGLVTYSIANIDGTTTLLSASRLHLTDPFRPLTLKESAGLFLRALSRKQANLEFRGGVAGLETWAKDQLAVNDDPTTPLVVEVQELQDVRQLGPDIVAEVWGAFENKRVTYRAYVEALTPFVHNDLPPGDDRNAWQLTDVYAGALLSVHLVSWASADYELKIVREPELLDAYQVINNVYLSFGVNASNKVPAKKCAE